MTETPLMSDDERADMTVTLRRALDARNIGPLDRKYIIIDLAANFIMSTNECFGGDRAQAMAMVDNFTDNVRAVVNFLIDDGGMRIEGVDSGGVQ
jgi:hypothetical protein